MRKIIGSDNYFATPCGLIWSKNIRRFLIPKVDRGYLVVTPILYGVKKNKTLHRLIAEAYLLNPDEKKTVNHKNGIRNDNCLWNLEYMTHSENSKHGFSHNGRNTKGDRSPSAKLHSSMLPGIRKRLDKGETALSIAKDFGVSRWCIYNIKYKRAW